MYYIEYDERLNEFTIKSDFIDFESKLYFSVWEMNYIVAGPWFQRLEL
jgi:hypothetical protein